jgi:hypothetical protein
MIARDRHGCERTGVKCIALAEKFDLPVFGWNGRYWMGWAKAHGLTVSEGLALMEEAFPFIVAELARCEAETVNIESRFIRITERLFYVRTDDDALIQQNMGQLIEILNDAFGVNN